MNKECTTREPPPTLTVCPRVLRHGLHRQIVRAVPAAAGHTYGAGCLHPVLDGGQEPLEAKVREGQDTLVQPDGSFGYAVYLQRERSHCEYT